MIAFSSFRPLDTNDEYRSNQLSANESWGKAFQHIIYFNERDERMENGIVSWIDRGNWPLIFELVEMAAEMKDWSCIINSDIFVSPDFERVETKLREKGAKAAVSYRYEYNPTNPLIEKRVVDNGLDIFCATPDVWKHVLKEIPREFRIGHPRWDTWMIGFLNTHYFENFFDFTASRTIYHPKHEGRKFGFEIKTEDMPFEAGMFAMPTRL